MDRPARLTSDLLARKGDAEPAIGGAMGLQGEETVDPGQRRRALLGGGHDAAATIALDRHRPAPHPADGRRQVSDGGGTQTDPARRIALTLRLDPDRHTKLRILAARRERSSQDLLVEALDSLLEAAGRTCACLRSGPGSCGRP